jgi:hypothetical protein
MNLLYLIYFVCVVIGVMPICHMALKKFRIQNYFYICRHDFPMDISFELVKESFTKRLLGGEPEIQIGRSNFDESIYISSDIPIIRRVLGNDKIRGLIMEIVSHPNIHGIYVEDKQIKLLTTNIGKNNDGLIIELKNKYDEKVSKLRDKFIEEFKKVMVDKEVQLFSTHIKDNINKIEAFSYSLFLTSILFIFYFCLVDIDDYFYLESFSIKQIFYGVLILFIPILLVILKMTKYSARRHLLIPSTFFVLLPACCLSSVLFLYHLNIYFDSNEKQTSVEKLFTEYKRSGKSTYYYLYFDKSQNDLLRTNQGLRISSNKYHRLSNVSEAQFTVGKGYFNVPYIKIK